MLLVKYENLSILKNDSYIEEVLFKYEKNVLHFQKYEKEGRQNLFALVQLASSYADIKESFKEINELFLNLTKLGQKFEKLKEN